MRVWSAAPVLVLLVVGLAGCSDDGRDPKDETFDDFGDVNVDESMGILRGIVIDTSIFPVEGVHVTVLSTAFNATSNEKGAWLIADVPPGAYFLEFSKNGYDTVQANAEVRGGVKEPSPVRVQMTKLPGSEPTYDPFSWDGYIGCTYRRPGISGIHPEVSQRGTSCPYVDTLWPEHDFYVDYELDRVPTYVTSDQVWKSTQHFGGEMSFNLRRTDGNCDTVDIEGTSPLHLSMGEAEIALHSDRCNSQGGFGPDMPLRVMIFTAHLQETEPPVIGGWGFGLQYEQDFQVYTHIFYNYAPPEDWRFTDDSTVPEPPQ